MTEANGSAAAAAAAQAVRIAEALLFVGGAPMKAADLADKLPPGASVADALMALKRKYAGGGVELVETGEGWRFQTARDLAALFRTDRVEQRKLPRAAMETLAVIAYHQPVTRSEIEELRGVSLGRGTLDLLMEIGWIRPRGRRRTPGKPLTFGVTDAFLSHFGLTSLDALPGKADLSGMGLSDARADAAFEALPPGVAPSYEEEPLEGGGSAPTFYVEFAEREE